jgi:thiol:disulfide interchange protein
VPRKFSLTLAALAVATAACGGNSLASNSPRPRPTTASPTTSPPASAFPPEVYADGFSRHRNAKAEIAAALARASADKRPLLLDFGADWCPNCTVVEKAFRTKDVRRVLAGYHVVTVDVGRLNRNIAVARKYRLDVRATGIPALVILHPNAERQAEIDGGAFSNDPGIPAEALVAWLKRNS